MLSVSVEVSTTIASVVDKALNFSITRPIKVSIR